MTDTAPYAAAEPEGVQHCRDCKPSHSRSSLYVCAPCGERRAARAGGLAAMARVAAAEGHINGVRLSLRMRELLERTAQDMT